MSWRRKPVVTAGSVPDGPAGSVRMVANRIPISDLGQIGAGSTVYINGRVDGRSPNPSNGQDIVTPSHLGNPSEGRRRYRKCGQFTTTQMSMVNPTMVGMPFGSQSAPVADNANLVQHYDPVHTGHGYATEGVMGEFSPGVPVSTALNIGDQQRNQFNPRQNVGGYANTPDDVAGSEYLTDASYRMRPNPVHGFNVATIPPRGGVATDPGRPSLSPLTAVLVIRPFDKLASDRLNSHRGVYGQPFVATPPRLKMEADGKFPAGQHSPFTMAGPTVAVMPGRWPQEQQAPANRKRSFR